MVKDDSPTTGPFLHYIKKYPRPFALGLTFLLFTNILDVVPPLIVGIGIDLIAEQKPVTDQMWNLLLLLGLVGFTASVRVFWRLYWGRFNLWAADDLRRRIFNQFTFLGPSFFKSNSVGQLMSLINNDVNHFRMAIGPGFLIFVDALTLMLFLPPIMIWMSWEWTWKTLILMPLIPFFVYRIIHLIHSSHQSARDRYSELSGDAQEIIAGIRVIKAYAQEDNKTRLFNGFNRNMEQAYNKVARVNAFFTPTLELAVTAGTVVLLWVGGAQVIAGTATIGSLVAFYRYIQRMVWPMTAIGIALSHFQQGRASFGRISELLLQPLDTPDLGPQKPTSFESLKVTGLNFQYADGDRPMLKSIDFEIKKGEIVGIVGPTGAGKSTLLNTLCRLYPVADHSIQINGHCISQISQEHLRDLMAYVPQEAFLFSDHVWDNIALGTDVSDQDMQQVTNMVCLKQEIEKLPGQFSAQLGERGVNLSGGQKQRLALARALIRKAPLMIFDDSLSAVDIKTETSILHQLRGFVGENEQLTAIIVSHRISSLSWCDRILVLNDGRIEAAGTHQSLLIDSPTYARLAQLQTQSQPVPPRPDSIQEAPLG